MYEGAVQNLIDELGRLPGVGPKSAQRIAFYILNSDASDMARLTNAISKVKSSVSFCEICGNVSETKQCVICRDDRRDPGLICVVEESKDVVAIERTRSFTGRYHVLGGAINPLAGLGPEQLRIRELVSRLADERIQEIILAMDPNLEGEATATYLSRMLVPLGIRLSRLASGLPVGGDLEYADEITLGRALEGRRVISEGAGIAQGNAAEDFEQVVDEEQTERERADAKPKAPRKRWSGSMFDDLDDSSQGEPEDSPSDNPHDAENDNSRADSSPSPGTQTTVDEALIEQALDDSAHADAPGSKDSPDSPKEAQPESHKSAAQAEQIPVDITRADAYRIHAHRSEDYEARIRKIQEEPLRTPTPEVPPLPGAKYVNPWS
ncbi:recombination protein RecR [Rothia dentocariosa ATCC 17931]|uniref:Recombination protein RecR n=1 Tax=Rothia dentocariosa (strain ATCC 17931 / CDC X599 / XDIA) TaxID=762948 RepID=E3H4P2_ROTDC|nr:recombination mediator RecR [Rothia dentocariosa]ADP40675.1 recombination protein RecR [Rothia dentocariosa ATCC 17931]WMS31463.1 recombination mediator RecR [Rothia dentocariosa]SUE36486.1 Recombination protein RecR [Rothia dentocariosa]